MKMDLNKLRDRAYKTACEHGFHEKEYSDAHWLMLVITEIAEAVQADRNNLHADLDYFRVIKTQCDDSYFGSLFEQCVKDSVEDELADVIIRLLDFAGMRNIDLSKLSEKLNERYYKLCLNCSENENFSEMMYDITKCICIEENIKYKIYDAIGCVFSVAYHHHIDLFQHIEWKMRYNELRPRLNGKEY